MLYNEYYTMQHKYINYVFSNQYSTVISIFSLKIFGTGASYRKRKYKMEKITEKTS